MSETFIVLYEKMKSVYVCRNETLGDAAEK